MPAYGWPELKAFCMNDVRIFELDPEKIASLCDKMEKGNFDFRSHINSGGFDQKKFNEIVDEVEKLIDCTECGNCCRALFPVVTSQDIRRLAKHLSITEKFMSRYVKVNAEGKTMLKNKPCIFLKGKRCGVYNIRPKVCRYFPDVRRDLTDRTFHLLYTARICPIVFNALENAKRIMMP